MSSNKHDNNGIIDKFVCAELFIITVSAFTYSCKSVAFGGFNDASLCTKEGAVLVNLYNLCCMVNCGITVFISTCFVTHKEDIAHTGNIFYSVSITVLINLCFNNIIIIVIKEIGLCCFGSFYIIVTKKRRNKQIKSINNKPIGPLDTKNIGKGLCY